MDAMRPCADSEFEWIRTGRREFPPRNDPHWKCLVHNLVPNQFEAYAKILHSVQASYKNIDDPHPLTEPEIAVLKIPPCTKLRSFIEGLREQSRGPRIRWKTLAQLLSVPFEAEICHEWFRASMEDPICWPRFLLGPDDGNLNAEELPEVLSALRPFSSSIDCFFRFSEWPFIGKGKPLLFRGVLDDLTAFLANGKYQFTPEYWWPADRSWCLCSEFDLTFTIIGGSRNLVSAVLNNSTLETLEVASHTRLDNAAPLP
jgi:hypothetical protein